MHHDIPKILRYEDLKALFKISRSSLARWEAAGKFPARIKISENSVGWRSDQVQEWLNERADVNNIGEST